MNVWFLNTFLIYSLHQFLESKSFTEFYKEFVPKPSNVETTMKI
ncbi:hypothetical protein LEP1GSC112_2290 [Leptospira interrogans serovar Pomona str. UT364]|nr:hypothetical protein LEP1GSC112_2290 [Leptospira interrogans serovar Pomona str. UT364]